MSKCRDLLKVLGLIVASLCVLSGGGHAIAQVPQLLNYQGRVVISGTNYTGTAQFAFALVNGNGTTSYWSNDGTSVAGNRPAAAVSLAVSSGLYSLALGDTSLANMTTIPYTVFANTDVRLRIWLNDNVHGWQQLAPDQRIAAVGYAMVSSNAAQSSLANYAVASGSAAQSGVAAYASTAGTSGTSGFSTQSERAGYAAQSGTASFASAAAESGTATFATSAVAAGISPLPAGQAGEYVAPWGNDATAVRATGTDANSAMLAAAYPFLTGTKAYSVAQAYDEMRFAPGTWGAPGTPAGPPAGMAIPLYIHGSGAGSYSADYSQIIGGTRFCTPVGWWTNSASQPVIYGPRITDCAIDGGSAVTGAGAIGGSLAFGQGVNVYPQVVDGYAANIRLLGPNVSNAGELMFFYCAPFSGAENINVAYGGQATFTKSPFTWFRHIVGYNNFTCTFLIKNAGDTPFLAHDVYVDDIVSTGTTGAYALALLDADANNASPLRNISASNIYSSSSGNGMAVHVGMSGTANACTGITIKGIHSNNEGGAYILESYDPNAKPVYANVFGGDATNDTTGWETATFVGNTVAGYGTHLFGVRADGCSIGFQKYPGDYSDLIDCTANNCAIALNNQISNGVLWMPHPLIVTGTGNAINSASGAPETPPMIFWGNAFQPVSNTTAATSVLNPGAGPKYIGGRMIPMSELTRPIHIHAYGTYNVTGLPGVVFSLYLNGVAIPGGLLTFNPTGATGNVWELDAWIQFRANGPTGSNQSDAYIKGEMDGVKKGTPQIFNQNVATMTDATIDLRAAWSVAAAANAITCQECTIEMGSAPTSGQ